MNIKADPREANCALYSNFDPPLKCWIFKNIYILTICNYKIRNTWVCNNLIPRTTDYTWNLKLRNKHRVYCIFSSSLDSTHMYHIYFLFLSSLNFIIKVVFNIILFKYHKTRKPPWIPIKSGMFTFSLWKPNL